jgi:NOL1/NOP2/fmu family ribosome biogenesis protein
MKPLTSSDKKKIIEQLNKQFGITELPYLIIQFGKEKLRLYTGSLSKEELYYLDNEIRVENIGLYFAKQEDEGIRLTIDGVQLLKNQITKNIVELDDNQANEWLKGNDLNVQTEKGWKILKHKDEFLGCGKSTGEKISNFMPKERRIKN